MPGRITTALLLLVLPLLAGCLTTTPYQSAHVLEADEEITTLSVTRDLGDDAYSNDERTVFEVAARMPLDPGKIDWGANMALVRFNEEGDMGGMFGGDIKMSLIRNHLAFDLPVRLTFLGDATFHTTHVYPRLIGSWRLNSFFEINTSASRFLFLFGESESLWGYSLGLAIGKPGRLVVRPEIGRLFWGENEDTWQLGVGIEFPPQQGPHRRTGS